MDDDGISHYRIPAFWETYATEQQIDMMANLAFVLRSHTRPVFGPIHPDEAKAQAVVHDLLGRAAEEAMHSWTVETLAVEDDDRSLLRTILVDTPEGKYFLIAFPLEAIELQKEVEAVGEQMTALRERATE